MNWAHHAILKLQAGEQATINPHGPSMKGYVESGDTVVVAPVPMITCTSCKGSGAQQERASCQTCNGAGEWPDLDENDIVLVKVRGTTYLHLIKRVTGTHPNEKYTIANARRHENGDVRLSAIYGVAISVAGRVVKTLPEVKS